MHPRIFALGLLCVLFISAYFFASSGLATEQACDWDRVNQQPFLVRALLWWDRAAARLTYLGNDAGRGKYLYDAGYTLGCKDEQTTPYFEDAVVAFDRSVGKLDASYIDALTALATRYMFKSFGSSPKAAALWRQIIALTQLVAPHNRDDINVAKYMLAYTLAKECYSNNSPKVVQEAKSILDEFLRRRDYKGIEFEAYEILGDIEVLSKRFEPSEPLYREALKIQIEYHQPSMHSPPREVLTAAKLALVLATLGKIEDALKILANTKEYDFKYVIPARDEKCLGAPLAPQNFPIDRSVYGRLNAAISR